MFKDKCIVLGITGSIAAYKAIDLVSRFRKKGARVYCVLTEAAQKLVTPLTLQTISQNPVITDLFAPSPLGKVPHIDLAQAADLVLVAPATANLLAKIRAGIADDFLSTMLLATKAPVALAPAMNQQMYLHSRVQENIAVLKNEGYFFIEPASGDLACGEQGQGRLAPLQDILAQVAILLTRTKPLAQTKVLITAGPTREPLDPVRFLSNYSTGKMGYALAQQASLWGAEVLLISGPTNLKPFYGVKCLSVETAREMSEAVLRNYQDYEVIIKTAAVADYRPADRQTEKIKKGEEPWSLALERNPDILAELGRRKQKQILVGFAAETRDVLAQAAQKVKAKNLDFIVANDLTQPGAGFAEETNQVSFVFPDGQIKTKEKMSKIAVAQHILQEISRIKGSEPV